jgi:hypothetical protein
MKFYLGTHMVSQPWWDASVPLFVSRRRLADRKTLPTAHAPWVLDSGGFTELNLYHYWQTPSTQYAQEVRRFADEIGQLAWVAPQDWMCEPFILAKTRATVREHQTRTVASVVDLRIMLGEIVIPVLQGWTLDDYLRCIDLYTLAGFDLTKEPIVGIGSVCRRQNMTEAGHIFRRLHHELGDRLHGFGVKLTGLESYSDALASADSMAWSYRARRDWPLEGCTHKSCNNCLRYALRWRSQVCERLSQTRLEVAA